LATLNVQIIPATEVHAEIIAANVRPEDAAELWATCYALPEKAMHDGIRWGEYAFTGCADGVPVCMFGVYRDSFLVDIGTPWMVGSRLLDRYAKTFIRHCRPAVVEMLRDYDRLENYVDARNTRSINWLRRLGFTVEEQAMPYGVLKLPFHKFWKVKDV
jgi:hypothetical protein